MSFSHKNPATNKVWTRVDLHTALVDALEIQKQYELLQKQAESRSDLITFQQQVANLRARSRNAWRALQAQTETFEFDAARFARRALR